MKEEEDYVFVFVVPMLAVFLQTSQHSSRERTSQPIAGEVPHCRTECKQLEKKARQAEEK